MHLSPADSADPAEGKALELLRRLRATPQLLRAIAFAQRESVNELQQQARLRQEFPEDLVRAGLQLLDARTRAADKFTRAEQMWLDRVGCEQATAEEVARHKARRFSGEVDDLCCGIGGDALALAAHCERVHAIDQRASVCLMASWNAEVYDVADRVRARCADVTGLTDRSRLVHIDPDRRATGRGRSLRVEDYCPGLEFLLSLVETRAGGAIKLGPASNFGGKFFGCEIELISLRGECKEATVWFGELAGEAPFRATLLPSGETIAGDPLDLEAVLSAPARYVYDPDPAVVRAGLLDAVAGRLNLQRLDEADEYLTADHLVDSPFVQAFELLAELPNSERQIRQFFRTANAGQVEIKCRHLHMDANKLRRKLSLDGDEALVLVFARVASKARALVCRRLSAQATALPTRLDGS